MSGKEADKITKLSEAQIDSFNKNGNFEEIEKISMDPKEAEKLPSLKIENIDKNIKKTFYEKLAKIQGEDIEIPKSAYMNYKDYYYATLDDIIKVYKPLLTEAGLVIVNNVDFEKMLLTTRVIDINNPEIEEKATWKITGKDSQSYGASLTYGKRYLISALLNVATGEDFDGETPEKIEKAAQAGYYQPQPQKQQVQQKIIPKNNNPAPTPQIESNPVKPAKKVFGISEKQLNFAKDLYEKYKTVKGAEAWALEKILAEKYGGKTTLESLNGIQAKDFIDEMLKRV